MWIIVVYYSKCIQTRMNKVLYNGGLNIVSELSTKYIK